MKKKVDNLAGLTENTESASLVLNEDDQLGGQQLKVLIDSYLERPESMRILNTLGIVISRSYAEGFGSSGSSSTAK